MKRLHYFFLVLLAAACSPGTTSETSTDSTAQAAIDEAIPDNTVFVNWMEVGVRDSPSEKGKYVTTVYLAENVELLGDTASEISGKTRVHYNKVRLLDGKEVWIRTDFIGIDMKPAVIIKPGSIFSRPDRVAVTPKKFELYDVVAVKPANGKDGWLEVKGKASGENWFTHGYLSAEDVLTDATEVQFAALKMRAAVAKEEKMREVLEAQLQDPQFSSTRIYTMIFGAYQSEGASDNYGEPEYSVNSQYLVGEWSREWEDQDGNTVSEIITITTELEYVADNGSRRMSISGTTYSQDGSIEFVRADENTRIDVSLTVVNYSVMKGTESQGEGGVIDVTYTRVGG